MTDSQDATPQNMPAETEQPRITAPPRPFDAASATDMPAAADVSGDEVSADEDTDADREQELETASVAPDAPEPFQDLDELPALLEALLFVADHPIDAGYIARAVDVSVPRVERALDNLADSLRESRRGIRLQRGPHGVQLVSAPEAAAQVERFLGLEASRRLSTAALETLAIIAYRQPITRGQVDAIRGVSSDGAIATLRARDLIEAAGHAPGPGRPMLFRTTQRFLEHFGLERPGQLPPLPEDIDLPPAEIGAQLGLDEAAVIAALAPADAEDGTEGSPGEQEDAIAAAIAEASADAVDIPADVQALSDAAEHAFEVSRERMEPDV